MHIPKPTADELVGRCSAVSMSRLSDRIERRRGSLLDGRLSSGNLNCHGDGRNMIQDGSG